MKSQRKNSQISINLETFHTLELIKNQVFSKFNSLMNTNQIKLTKGGYFMGEPMPYPFIFSCDFDDENLPNLGENLELLLDDKVVGFINVSEIFSQKDEYTKNIFNTNERKNGLGRYCVAGEFEIFSDEVRAVKSDINRIKTEQNAKKITAVMLTADPINRAHERLIRMAIDKADLVIIFLLQTNTNNHINFELRKMAVEHFIQNYLPHNRVVIMPFRANIFSSHKNPTLECIAAYNLGANKLVIGQNHSGIGMFFDQNQPHTILDSYINDLKMEIIVLPELVYCNQCKTIVSTKTCPHGSHHHIKYKTDTIKSLLFNGIMPPTILVRSDISAIILSHLYPNRFKDIQGLCDELFSNSGLLEKRDECDFYKELMRLYQTSSLT